MSTKTLTRWLWIGAAGAGAYLLARWLLAPAAPTREAAPFRGNPTTRVFHAPDCRYFDAASTEATFASRAAALAEGYTPCSLCSP